MSGQDKHNQDAATDGQQGAVSGANDIPKLLVVDDDPLQLSMLDALMDTEGFTVSSCQTASEALQLSMQHKFDVAILDLRLQEIAGTALLQQIKVLNDEIRVIMYTAHGTFEAARDALNLGAFAFVEKSEDPQELIEIVRRARQAAQQQRRAAPDPRTIALRRTVMDLVKENRERCRAEQQQEALQEQMRHMQKMDAVGTLAAGIAHDFNNLLMVIMAYNTAVRNQTEAQDSLKPALDGIEEATRQAADLVRALLTFSRKSKVVRRPLRLCHLVKRSADLLSVTFSARHRVEVRVPDEPLWVSGDESQLQQVLLNLGTNARDAMPSGGTVSFVVEEGRDDEGRDEVVRLRVVDTGIGMSEATRQRIFEPFFTTKPRGQGAGLGMAVVHGVVADHHGQVAVESTESGGTTVEVRLPREEARPDYEPPEPPMETVSGDGRVAAVIEDNEKVRAIVADALLREGFHVEQAVDGWRGVDLIERAIDRISIVILDLDLPGIHGSKVLERIRSHAPDLPVLIITGDGETPADRFDDAATRMLYKPITLRQMLQVLGSMLMRAENRSSAAR